jgi:hypothetical protein
MAAQLTDEELRKMIARLIEEDPQYKTLTDTQKWHFLVEIIRQADQYLKELHERRH